MRPGRPSTASVSPKFAIGTGDSGGAGVGVGEAVGTAAVVRLGVDEGVPEPETTNPGVGLRLAVGSTSPPQARARKAVSASRTAVTNNLKVPK